METLAAPSRTSLTRPHAAPWQAYLQGRLAAAPPDAALQLDLSEVGEVDSVGAAVLAEFLHRAQLQKCPLKVVGLQQTVAQTLQLFAYPHGAPAEGAVRRPPLLESLGAHGVDLLEWLRHYLQLCADTAYFSAAGIYRPSNFRWKAVLLAMAEMGSQAAGVVAIIAFLVGGTVALQSAEQLRQFGANVFVADLIGVSITRELGPLITAIVVAGRSGAAVAAELGTMTVTEEIDALRTMGIHPVRYVLAPKAWALCITQPILSTLACAIAIGGGSLVAMTYLDVAPAAFCERLELAILPKDLLTGLFKSVLFAGLIVTLGANCGMRTRGGADAVGRSTTAAVVAGIFAIIAADALCSLLFYFEA